MFHSVSAFNNAGFVLYSDSLVDFALYPSMRVPLMESMVIAGLGFPVLHELRGEWRTPLRWLLHAKLIMFRTFVLLFGASSPSSSE